MTRALDVLKHINETSLRLGEVQRQKLLCYVQGWSLAWDGVPMFKDRIEAWKMGTVVPLCVIAGACGTLPPSAPRRRPQSTRW